MIKGYSPKHSTLPGKNRNSTICDSKSKFVTLLYPKYIPVGKQFGDNFCSHPGLFLVFDILVICPSWNDDGCFHTKLAQI